MNETNKTYDPFSPPPDDFVSEWKYMNGRCTTFTFMQAQEKYCTVPSTFDVKYVRDNWHLFDWARPIEPTPVKPKRYVTIPRVDTLISDEGKYSHSFAVHDMTTGLVVARTQTTAAAAAVAELLERMEPI